MQTKIIESESVIEETYEINNSVRPCESPRELLDVIAVEENEENRKEHSWDKQNLVIIRRAGFMYDAYKCTCCGITAKRYGIGPIVRDRRYSAEKYKYCK